MTDDLTGGDHFVCGFAACDETFSRAELGDGREVRADGGQPPLRRFTGECRCGRRVVTAVRRASPAMSSDPTARARCRDCGSTLIVRGDPPGEQRAMADGGRDVQSANGTERRDPAEDPEVCSLCGTFIGFINDDEYCDGCAREIGVKPPMRRCVHCGQRGPEEDMKAIDVSAEDEYYPEFEYLCPSCSGGDA